MFKFWFNSAGLSFDSKSKLQQNSFFRIWNKFTICWLFYYCSSMMIKIVFGCCFLICIYGISSGAIQKNVQKKKNYIANRIYKVIFIHIINRSHIFNHWIILNPPSQSLMNIFGIIVSIWLHQFHDFELKMAHCI